MPYNILLVDDDRELREEIKDALEDYTVVGAASGDEALEILQKPNEVDLVLLDVVMPGRRGTEILREIKKLAPRLSVIMMTGHSSKDVVIDSLRGRADDYIEKPVSVEKLKNAIESMLKSKDGCINSLDLKGKVEHVKRFLERNYHKKVSLRDAAKTVCLSPKYLSKIFKLESGEGFSDFKSNVKLRKAEEWLFSTGYNVNQISDELGYSNVESFIRAFKRFTGKTPFEYRKTYKKTSNE